MNIDQMPTRYDASSTETKWYTAWENAGLFQPSPDPSKEKYVITIPPPNITGSLHMGHALCYPLQDMIGRYQRLLGKSVLILPGQDHAGIATQSVVDKQLRKEGSSAAVLGREKFVERVWEWRKESGDTILNQFRALGCAFDWSRSRFTLDDEYARAVLKVFVDWFDRGLIFKGKRVVNWDPKLKTSVSDIETERQVIKGKLYHVRYPFADGSGDVVIATTRPETMLADVAVAVHPSDKRYDGLVGKMIRLPLVGREIPLVADLYPDPEFGTGAVKITPAHDANDYQVGVRHGLPMPVIMDLEAHIRIDDVVEFADAEGRKRLESYENLSRNEARNAIVKDLEEGGYLVKIDDHEIPIIISDRSKDVIEPLLSEQWFCDQPRLFKPVIEAVKAHEVKFHPARYKEIFLEGAESAPEWCLSRQLWWGHRIPVYTTVSGKTVAAQSWDEAATKAGEAIVSQDEDVLDTWFSSGLWPFATLGWPSETDDMSKFYPTSTLVTDRNIIKLWVARMLFMGYDLTGNKPFSDVVIYATVMREDGKRMSKSLGTGVDPMEIINTLGADALRWTLLSQTGENQELRYSERKTEDARNWCNKIWNATRFVLMNCSMDPLPLGEGMVRSPEDGSADLEAVDKWLLSRLFATEKAVRSAYDRYDLQSACQALYRFFWSELCDWYIEISKPRLQDPELKATPQWVLMTSLEAFLKMLSPIMPHLTEELYSFLPVEEKAPFLMSAAWPALPEWFDFSSVESELERVFDVVRGLRSLRASVDLAAMKTVESVYFEGSLAGNESIVASQGWVGTLIQGKPTGKFISTTAGGVDLHLPIEGLIDTDKEIARLDKEKAKLEADIKLLSDRLQNPQFVERAKPEIVERERANLADLHDRLVKNAERRLLF